MNDHRSRSSTTAPPARSSGGGPTAGPAGPTTRASRPSRRASSSTPSSPSSSRRGACLFWAFGACLCALIVCIRLCACVSSEASGGGSPPPPLSPWCITQTQRKPGCWTSTRSAGRSASRGPRARTRRPSSVRALLCSAFSHDTPSLVCLSVRLPFPPPTPLKPTRHHHTKHSQGVRAAAGVRPPGAQHGQDLPCPGAHAQALRRAGLLGAERACVDIYGTPDPSPPPPSPYPPPSHPQPPTLTPHNPQKDYPSEFPAKSKCLVLFQSQDGVDVILFAMYVYEYGHACPMPNQVSPSAERGTGKGVLLWSGLAWFGVCLWGPRLLPARWPARPVISSPPKPLERPSSGACTSRTWTRCTTSAPATSARTSTTRSSSPTSTTWYVRL